MTNRIPKLPPVPAGQIRLSSALSNAEVPGHHDIWSGLGLILVNGIWEKPEPLRLFAMGSRLRFRDRFGTETDFTA